MTPLDDETLNQTLARLTAVPIPDGLEQRVLTRLAIHAQSARPAPRPSLASRLGWPLLPRPLSLATMSLSAVGLVGLLLTSTVRRHHTPHPSPLSTTIQPASATQPARISLPPVPSLNQESSPATTAALTFAVSAGQNHNLPATRFNASSRRPDRATTNSPDADLALAELNAPSQLAPPLPLTDDERALQHLAQHSTPEVLRSLNSDRNNAQLLAEQDAFQNFFTKPVIPEATLKGETN